MQICTFMFHSSLLFNISQTWTIVLTISNTEITVQLIGRPDLILCHVPRRCWELMLFNRLNFCVTWLPQSLQKISSVHRSGVGLRESRGYIHAVNKGKDTGKKLWIRITLYLFNSNVNRPESNTCKRVTRGHEIYFPSQDRKKRGRKCDEEI